MAVEVSEGMKVTISPFSRPIAICLPFGDQDTRGVECVVSRK